MLQSDIVTAFFQHLPSFQNKMEPGCVINNITIATADDITALSDDVNKYPVDLSGTINTLSNDLNWLEKWSYFRPIFFFNLLSVILGTHPWPLSVHVRCILRMLKPFFMTLISTMCLPDYENDSSEIQCVYLR